MKFDPQPCSARINQPKRLHLVQALQAAPRAISGRHVDERQTDAGDDLQR